MVPGGHKDVGTSLFDEGVLNFLLFLSRGEGGFFWRGFGDGGSEIRVLWRAGAGAELFRLITINFVYFNYRKADIYL
jgi:hypothetical protein